MVALTAPFPWFGGKSRAAKTVWGALGDVPNYVEPFFGSGAVYLQRPTPHHIATLNDADGLVANFWRATQADPAAVARHADHPVFENDLHARHAWLVDHMADLPARLEGDPDYYDAKIAGWWCWGICCWIGRGFCSGQGPWRVVNRQLVHLGDAGQGVNRQLVHLGDAGRGVNRTSCALENYFADLSALLANARVCCGDWTRVCGPSPTFKQGLTGVFLDPPYGQDRRDIHLYRIDAANLPAAVQSWALANGQHPKMRIVVAGYAGEYPDLEAAGWRVVMWRAQSGYGARNNANTNHLNERLWLSPQCLKTGLFER